MKITMRIQIVTEEKLNDRLYLAAISEYQKRLSSFTNVRLLTMKEYRPTDREAIISVSCSGNTAPSESLAQTLAAYMLNGISTITFMFSFTNTYDCKETICLSNMKLSASLAACILHEQIYRGFMMINHRTYHK